MSTRDLTTAQRPIEAWLTRHLADDGIDPVDLQVDVRRHAAGGYSNEVLFVDATYRADDGAHTRPLVFRLPPAGPALFPSYDLAMEVEVQSEVGDHGVPVPRPIVHETDPTWLGTPFLVMPRVAGHDPGELPVADPWLGAATADQQRALHEHFLDALARVHTTPWRGRPVATVLRGADGEIDGEIDWWEELAAWTFDGSPPAVIGGVFAWCREHRPAQLPPSNVLWGDVRVGNVIFDDDFAPAALLDWEMASIGPAELDLAWYTALESMTEHFFGQRLPGFLTRDEIVQRHEGALGRPLVDFRWFEIFAMARAATLNIRTDRLRDVGQGRAPKPAEDSAVLAFALDAVRSEDANR